MIPKYRQLFNQKFSQENYQKINRELSDSATIEVGFRISETPIFLENSFHEKLMDVSNSIIQQIKSFPNTELRKAVPENCFVPNDTEKFHFLAIDFGICKNEKDEIIPQLIELQAFPSLFAFQKEYEGVIRQNYVLLNDFEEKIPKQDYITLIKEVIVGEENPENVILLELFPDQQKTLVDFIFTEKYLGIKTVCFTKVKKEGRNLYYENEGKKIQIKGIYNRIIFDELENYPDLKTEFNFKDDVNVKWVTHPNWFFKVSKYILPKLQHEFIPKSYFLNETPSDIDLTKYVLKPLFSFAGSGVNLNPTQEIIAEIKDKENYILQKKVSYHPAFLDINGDFSKAEIRLLYIWKENEENPQLIGNLVRMTKADMVNVNFNKKDAIWIGSSMAFFESDLKL